MTKQLEQLLNLAPDPEEEQEADIEQAQKDVEEYSEIMTTTNNVNDKIDAALPLVADLEQNEKGCYTADCHAHSPDQTYVGVLCVVMSLEKMDNLVEENQASMISVSIIITILLGFMAVIFLWVGSPSAMC